MNLDPRSLVAVAADHLASVVKGVRSMKRKIFVALVFLLLSLAGIPGAVPVAFAQETAADPAATPDPPAIDSGDNAWMLTSSALVLMMTAPGLAMFYSGLVRKKNVLGVMMQCVFLMGLMTVIWALWGYSLAFGGDAALDRQRRLPVHARSVQARLDRTARPYIPVFLRLKIPRADAHALPRHVLHHHAGADLRRVCRADEVQHDGRVLDPLGHAGLLPAVPLGVGRRHSGLRQPERGRFGAAGRSTSPAARWCTSAPASRR